MIESLPKKWSMVKLGDCLQRRKDTILPAKLNLPSIGLVGLEDIQDSGRGKIFIRPTQTNEINSLKTKFNAGDILYGKLRPYLNKVGIPKDGGFCSTEIWVFSSSSYLNSQYAAYFLSSAFFVEKVSTRTKGINLPRLDTETFDSIEIPVPPLSEQKRIVEILQEAEKIRNLRSEAETKTAELLPAMFSSFFGEIGENTKNWPVVPISHFVSSFLGGKSITGIDSDFDNTRPRVLKISAVTSGFLIPSESKPLLSSYEPPNEHYIKPGDLLITRANTTELVGATALIGADCPENLVLPDKIWRFNWKQNFEGTIEFVWALFQEQATRTSLGKIASGSGGSMKNISMQKLMQMRVVWPPEKLQETFSESLIEVNKLRNTNKGDKVSNSLLASLSARAFSGELTTDWRETHTTRLQTEAQERDNALKQTGATVSHIPKTKAQEIEELFELPTDGIYSDLNREQRALLVCINQRVGGVDYGRYFTAESLASEIDGQLYRNPKAIESHLALLASRGIILRVSRMRDDSLGNQFAASYRLVLKEDQVKQERLQHLRKIIAGNI